MGELGSAVFLGGDFWPRVLLGFGVERRGKCLLQHSLCPGRGSHGSGLWLGHFLGSEVGCRIWNWGLRREGEETPPPHQMSMCRELGSGVRL